jgi:hypothetical protein
MNASGPRRASRPVGHRVREAGGLLSHNPAPRRPPGTRLSSPRCVKAQRRSSSEFLWERQSDGLDMGPTGQGGPSEKLALAGRLVFQPRPRTQLCGFSHGAGQSCRGEVSANE